MANSGTNARQQYGRNTAGFRAQELWVEQGPSTESSFLPLPFDEINGFGLDEIFSNNSHPTTNSSFGISPQQRHQEGPSARPAVPRIIPSFGGELEKVFQAPSVVQEPILFQEPEQWSQFGNMEMASNFGGSFAVAPLAEQWTVTTFGSGNHQLPQFSNVSFNEASSLVAPSAAQGTVTNLDNGNYQQLPRSNRINFVSNSNQGSTLVAPPIAAQGTVTNLGSGNYQQLPRSSRINFVSDSNEGSSLVTPNTAQGTVTNLGNGNYQQPLRSTRINFVSNSNEGSTLVVPPIAAQGTATNLGSGNYQQLPRSSKINFVSNSNEGSTLVAPPIAAQGTVTNLDSVNYQQLPRLSKINFVSSSNDGSTLVVPPIAAQDTVTNLGNGNYQQLPRSTRINFVSNSNEGSSLITPNTTQDTVTSLGSSNYQLPISNSVLQCRINFVPSDEDLSLVAPPAAPGTVTNLDYGNYQLPESNLTPQCRINFVPSNEGSSLIAPTAVKSTVANLGSRKGTVSSVGNSNHHLPKSNLTSELSIIPSSNVHQLPTVQQPYSQNPLGAAIGHAPSAVSLPMTQAPNNPTLQLPKSRESTRMGKRATREMRQSQELRSVYPGAMSSNHQSEKPRVKSNHRSEIPNTEQQGLLGNKPTSKQLRIGHSSPSRNVKQLKTGNSSSPRNVKKKTTLPDNSQQLAPIQIGNVLNPPALQGIENPGRPSDNSVYDSMYEKLGFPVDPHMRMYMVAKHRAGGDS